MKVSVAIVEKCRERERHEQCAFAAGTYALPRYATAPADAADDQIVFFAGIGCRRPGLAVAQRVMGRSMPRARSWSFLLRWSVMYFPENLGPEGIFWIRQVTLPGAPLASSSILYIMTVTVYIYR